MFDDGMHKNAEKKLHQVSWKYNYFKYDDVSMLCNSCGFSQFTQFYDRHKKNQNLPYLYMGSYYSEKGYLILREKWIVDLVKSVKYL